MPTLLHNEISMRDVREYKIIRNIEIPLPVCLHEAPQPNWESGHTSRMGLERIEGSFIMSFV